MSYLDKLLGIVGMGSTIANATLLRKFLTNVMLVMVLTAISGTMAGMILIAGFYGLYLGLVHYGVDPSTAALSIGGLTLIITIGLASLAVLRFRHLRDIPGVMSLNGPIMSRVGEVADAFIDGLLTGRHE